MYFSGFQRGPYLSFLEMLLKVLLTTCTWQSNQQNTITTWPNHAILKPTLAGHLLDRGTTIVQHMLKTQSKGRKEEIRKGERNQVKSHFISISLEFNLYSHHQEKTWK
jgi:hypothetical protein